MLLSSIRTAQEALADYHRRNGGVPQKPTKSVKKRKPAASLKEAGSIDESSPDPTTSRKRRRGSAESEIDDWTPKGLDWEPQIAEIKTVARDDDGKLLAYIRFKNGKNVKVRMDLVYKHCPRPMLKFYEEHLYVQDIAYCEQRTDH